MLADALSTWRFGTPDSFSARAARAPARSDRAHRPTRGATAPTVSGPRASVVKRWNLAMIRLSSVFMPQPHCRHPAPPRRWFMRGTRADGQRQATALRRPAIQYSGGIALHLPRPNTPRPNTWPLNSQRLGRFRPYCPSDPLRPTVWRVYHIPPDKLLACFGNFRRHSSARRAMALGMLPTDVERTACDRPAAARGCPRYPLSSASSPSAMAHARNARAAPRALASPEISSRRRTTRSRRYGNRGLTYVRANSAASSRVRRVTSCARRRGGSNTKSGMPRKLARHNPVPVPSYIMSDTLSLRWTTARRVQAPAVRISRGVFPVQRLNACVNALTS